MNSDRSEPLPPSWVRKRDGRVVPFEAGRISSALFGAAERLGRPDALLARDLTDAVLHFLAQDGRETVSAEEVAEVVAQVVRELGHPALAEAFAKDEGRRTKYERRAEPSGFVLRASSFVLPLAAWRAECVRDFSRRWVFARDLVSAHDAGLLHLAGLEAPDSLAGCVLRLPAAEGVGPALADLTAGVRGWVALDGPDHLPGEPAALAG